MSRETGLLTYAVVTPARDEADNIRRLAASLADQVVVPTCWVVVDDGSRDETEAILEDSKRTLHGSGASRAGLWPMSNVAGLSSGRSTSGSSR